MKFMFVYVYVYIYDVYKYVSICIMFILTLPCKQNTMRPIASDSVPFFSPSIMTLSHAVLVQEDLL